MDQKNRPEDIAAMELKNGKTTAAGELAGERVGNEYLLQPQTSQPAPLPEGIPTTLETEAEAKRAASRKAVTQSFWSLVLHQFKKNRVAVYALYIVYFLFGIAIFADLLANDKPLFAN